jgi:L-seryl-tRNA(Ser) seleniumtransferase
MKEKRNDNRLAALPQIEALLQEPLIQSYFDILGRPVVADLVREVLASIRVLVLQEGQDVPAPAEIVEAVGNSCHFLERERLQRVINATGIMLHTNMGRSPLPRELWTDVEELNCGYSNLELDLATGKRGKRKGLIPLLIAKLTGAEDALVVNNNAAAIFLILQALAREKDVVVSRGEQVQIGGGFRIPDILEISGARLVEVGTTNITTAEDYRCALTEDTGMILAVHRSNFAIRGFAKSPSIAELAKIKPQGVPLCVDQGSGLLDDSLSGEVSLASLLRSGADLVSFSGDKLLGGPQAGIIAGRRELIRIMEHHPMMRAFRPGKTVYSLLEALLVRRLNGRSDLLSTLPGGDGAGDLGILKRRGRKLLRQLNKNRLSLVDSLFTTGGGSLPDESFPSLSVRIESEESAGKILRTFREASPPVIGTISSDRVHLNLATIRDDEIPHLRNMLKQIIGE